MTYYSNVVHFDPDGHETYFSNVVSFETTSIPAIEGSVDFLASATMSINAQKIKGASFAPLTGQTSLALDYIRIRESSANMFAGNYMNIRPHIIANAASDLKGQAILEAKALRLIIPEGIYEITADDYFRKNQPADSSSVANYIIVETQPLKPSDTIEEIFSTSEIRSIEAGESIIINAEYSEKPAIEVRSRLEDNTANTTITNASYYACNAEIEITNNGTSQDSFNLIIEGKPLKVQGVEKAHSKDDRSITENGKIEYTLPTNHLVQTRSIAQKIADKLKDSFADPKRDISLDWRGNPALILADQFSAPEFQQNGINKIGKFYATKQEIEYDGGLRANMEGRKNE